MPVDSSSIPVGSQTKSVSWIDWRLVLASFLLLMGMGELALFDQDEAAYAGFARRMIETGDWLIPEFPWSEPHRKTPLHFWTIAVSFKLFGQNEWALRLPSMLSLVGTAFAVRWLAPQLWGKATAKLAAELVLASIILFVYGGISFTDGLLMFCQTVAALALLRLWQQPGIFMALIFWVGVAAGALAKGPPIVILTFGMVGLLWLITILGFTDKPRVYAWWALVWGCLAITALAPLTYWVQQAWQRDNGQFITWLWEWYVTKRAGGAVWGQTGPPGYHLLVIGISLLVALPWYVAFVRAQWLQLWTGQWRSAFKHDFSALALWVWLLPGWLFYELQFSKLPSYALGAYGAFVIGVAMQVQAVPTLSKWSVRVQQGLLVLLSLGCLLLAALGLGQLFTVGWQAGMLIGVVGAMLASLLWFLLSQKATTILKQAGKPGQPSLLLMAMALAIMPLALQVLEPSRAATKLLAAEIKAVHKPAMGSVLLCNNYGTPSLPFYLEQQGLVMEHQEGVDAALVVMAAGKPRIMVMEPERWEAVKSKLADLKITTPYKVDTLRGAATDRAAVANFTVVIVG